MANELRTRDGLPFNFVDGLRIKGVDVTNWDKVFIDQGASYVGFTPVGNLGATNVQGALAELDVEKVDNSALAATAGSSLVGHDGSTVQAVLDTVKPIANYTALRAYTGSATQVRVTTTDIAGFFYRDDADTTSGDNGGTVIVANNGKRWKRLFDGAVNVKWFGAKGDWNGTTGTDDTVNIQKAIDYCTISKNNLSFPVGVYLISAPLVISESSGLSLKAEKYRGVTLKKTSNTVDEHYSVDALVVIKNTAPAYGYNHHIDGICLDAKGSSNIYGIYAPRISQAVFENLIIHGAKTGIYSEDSWLCSLKNVDVCCGDSQNPTSVPSGSVAFSFGSGTSLFMQNCWARVCETGYYFRTAMAYSNLVSCGCDYFTSYAYRFAGSTFAMNGCGSEATVGPAARIYSFNNSRVSMNGCQTYSVAPLYYWDLELSEVVVENGRYDDSVAAGTGTVFRANGGSVLSFYGRTYPGNTATVFTIDASSRVVFETATTGKLFYFYDTAASAVKSSSLPDKNGNIKSAGNIVLPYNKQYHVTNSAGTEQIVLSKNISDLGVDVRNVDTSGVFLHNGGARRVEINNFNLRPVTDNALTLGDAAARWSVVYAINGAINTSDEREKQQVREILAAEKRVAIKCKSLLRAFKWNHSVEEKGNNARIHFGIMAQDVLAAFESEGLNAADYGVFCYDEWEARPEVKDEAGNIVMSKIDAGNRYGIRYDELLTFLFCSLD